MTVRRRSPRRLDNIANRSPLHAAGVGVVRFILPLAVALAVGYGLVAAESTVSRSNVLVPFIAFRVIQCRHW